MDSGIFLERLLEGLLDNVTTTSNDIDELSEKLRNIRKTIRLLEEAPLLALAMGWGKGNCMKSKVVEYPFRIEYNIDRSCLMGLAVPTFPLQ